MNSPATVQRYDIAYTRDPQGRHGFMPQEMGRVVLWEDHCRALEAAQREVAEMRGKVASLEKERKLLKFETDLWYHHCGNGSTALAQLNKMEAERDEARGLLIDAKVIGKHSVSCYRHMNEIEGDGCICGWDGVTKRIDAFLGESP